MENQTETHYILSEVAMTVDSENFLKKWNHSILQKELWPFPLSFSCCSSEMRSFKGTYLPPNQMESSEVYRSPEKSDLLVVGGTITQKMAPFIKEIYDRMPEEKWVLAIGACASSGGPYWTHTTVQGLSQIIPVDVYLPGCPPTPEMIIQSFETIKERIAKRVSAYSQTKWSMDV